ncbi:MAG: hypothetical protein AB8C95_04145 [Phycisphaeraceae bacterium]
MKTKLALCAILMMALSAPAFAGGNQWGNWPGFSSDWCNWENVPQIDLLGERDRESQRKGDRKGDRNKRPGKFSDNDCNWGKEPKKKKKDKKKKGKKGKKGKKNGNNCEPTAVPSPTAAIAGLGMMGLMLGRRRNKKA